jgi:hypothetical protein
MPGDRLREVLLRAECDEPVFSVDEMQRWPSGELEQLTHLGLLRESEPARAVACDACGDWHVEEVLWQPSVREPSGQRAYLRCPVEGLVHVPVERLRQWAVDPGTLARHLAAAMELAGTAECLIAGRLWKLGRRRLAGRFRDVFFALSRQGTGVAAFAAQHLSAPSGVLLTLGGKPQCDGWHLPDFTVFDVKDVTALCERGLNVDLDYIEDALPAARGSEKLATMRGVALPEGTDWRGLRIEIAAVSLSISAGAYSKELPFEEAGFSDSRQAEAAGDRALQILRLFAQRRGCVALDALPAGAAELTRFRKQISALRTRLKALFAIDEEPIPFDKKSGEYRCAFEIRLNEDHCFPTPAGATWLRFRIEQRQNGRVAVGLSTETTFRSRAGTAMAEVAERQEWNWREYSLDALRLAREDGSPTPEGRVLLECLTHGGRIERAADDAHVLKLGRALRDWTGLKDDPFSYGVDAHAWVAQFECGAYRLP